MADAPSALQGEFQHMKRGLLFVLLISLLISKVEAADYPVTCTDAFKLQFTFTKQPVRIVSLAPSNTEILFALGLGKHCVGATSYCDYPPQAKKVTRVGGFADMSVEKIVSLSPDLVLAIQGNPDWLLKRLRGLGVTVFSLNPKTLDDVQSEMLKVARVCGVSATGEKLVAAFRAEIASVTAALVDVKHRPRVYYGAWNPPFYTPGPGSFIYDLVELAGGRNITEGEKSMWLPYSLERIIQSNPEVIIHGMEGVPEDRVRKSREAIKKLRGRAGWRTMTAVKEGRVYLLSDHKLQRPGPRLSQGLRELAAAVHPEAFQKRN
jgi:cobalamin transport system substrate-binding protein